MKARVPSQILAALKKRPMTVAELLTEVNSTPEHVRTVILSLEDGGSIRRGSTAPRHYRKGAIPRYWELAA
jgi:predicted transcriptional regulator